MLAFVAAIRTIHGTLSHAVFGPQAQTRLIIANQMGHKYAQIVYEIDAGELKRLCLTGAPFER